MRRDPSIRSDAMTMQMILDASRAIPPMAIVPGPPAPMAIEHISRALDSLEACDIGQMDLSALARQINRGELLCLSRLAAHKAGERA